MTARLLQINKVKVAEIAERDRMRPVSEAGVKSLIASISEIGIMKDAIHIRQRRDGQLVLIAGGHRLEAARRLGWEEIEAKVWADLTDDMARLMEIDDNLAGAEMNALDTAVFLATRKEVYERMHPETRHGIAGAVARWDATDIVSVASFATATAEKFGLTDRHVRRMIAAGSALSPRDVAQLRSAPRPVSLKDLAEIAKIGNPVERGDVVLRLAAGNARSAADARRSLRVEAGLEGPKKSAEDEQLLALLSAWSRAGKAVRRRFVEERFADLNDMVGEVAEAEETAPVATFRRGIVGK